MKENRFGGPGTFTGTKWKLRKGGKIRREARLFELVQEEGNTGGVLVTINELR